MRKLFKKGFLTVTSLASIAGSVATVVACGEAGPGATDSQKDYDDALKALSEGLTNTPISIDIVHGSLSAGLDSVKTKIENAISTLISSNPATSTILGAPTVTVNPGTFDDTQLSSTEKTASNLSVVVAPQTEGSATPNPLTFSVSYRVINNDQDNYDQEVNRLLSIINSVDSTAHTFSHGEFSGVSTASDKIKTFIMESINSSIDDNNLYVSKFSNINQLPDITANIATILSNVAAGSSATINPETLIGFKFISKVGGSINTNTPHNVTFNYRVVGTKQEQFAEQVSELVGKFSRPNSGTFTHPTLAMINNESIVNATTKIQAQINEIVARAPALYSAVVSNSPTIAGLTATSFQKTAGDYSTEELMSGLTISFNSTFPPGDVTPIQNIPFSFYYTVQPSTPESNAYSNALTDIVNHLKETTTPGSGTPTPTNPITFDYNATTDATAWKTAVQNKIKATIFNYVNSAPFTTAHPTVFSLGNNATASSNNIQVTVSSSNFVNQISTTPTILSSGISFTIPSAWTGSMGIQNISNDLTIYKTVAPTQSLVASAASKIKNYFSAATNKITMKRLGVETAGATPTQKTVQEYIAEAINNYLTTNHTNSGTDIGLNENEKAALGPVSATTVIDTNSIDISTNATNVTKTAIGLKFIGTISSQIATISDFTLHYDVVANPNDSQAQTKLETIISNIIAASATTKLGLVYGDSATAVADKIKALILTEAQKTENDIYFKGVALSDITISPITIGAGDDKIDTNLVNSFRKTITGHAITATIAVKATATHAANPTAVSLTGLEYTVVKNNQQLYDDQIKTLMSGFQTYTDTNGLGLYTHIDDATIKTKVRDLFVAYLATLTTAQKNLITPTAADQKGLDAVSFTASTEATKSFDTSTVTASAITRTSSGLSITVQPSATPTGVSATTGTANIKYTVGQGGVQSDYTAAMTVIKEQFSNNSMFTVQQDTTLDSATLRTKVQDAIYAYVTHSAGKGYLSADQKAAIKVSNKTDIVVEDIPGTLNTHTLGQTITGGQIKITIPSYLGVTSSQTEMTGAIYTVEKTDAQVLYEAQVNNVVAAVTSESDRLKLLDDDAELEINQKLIDLLNAYILDATHAADTSTKGTSTLNRIVNKGDVVFTTPITPVRGTSSSGSTYTNISIYPKNSAGLTAYSKKQLIYWSIRTAPQAAYDDEVEDVLNNLGNVYIYLNDDETKIKQQIVNVANIYIDKHRLSHVKHITTTDIANTGIDTSTTLSNGSTNISVTFPKADGTTVTVAAVTKLLNYIIPSNRFAELQYEQLANQVATGIYNVASVWGSALDADTLSKPWTKEQMSPDSPRFNFGRFSNTFGMFFTSYYNSLSEEIRDKMLLLFAPNGAVMESYAAAYDVQANFTSISYYIKFKSTATPVTTSLSSNSIEFHNGP